MATAV